MILPCHVLCLWPEKMVNSYCKTSHNNHRRNSLRTTVYLPMGGSPCGSPIYSSMQWDLAFFLFYLSEALLLSFRLVSTLETHFWVDHIGYFAVQGVGQEYRYKNKTSNVIQQLTPCISIQRNLMNWEFNQLEFGLHMEEGGGKKKRIKLMPWSKRQPRLPSIIFSLLKSKYSVRIFGKGHFCCSSFCSSCFCSLVLLK